jgi:hypothetical protein
MRGGGSYYRGSLARNFRPEVDDGVGADHLGPHVSKNREGGAVPVQELGLLGRGPVLASGRIVSCGLFLFSLLFLLFIF